MFGAQRFGRGASNPVNGSFGSHRVASSAFVHSAYCQTLNSTAPKKKQKTNKIYWQTEHRYDKLDHSKYRFSVPIARFQYIFALQLFVHLIWPRCTLHTDGRRYSDFMASLSGVLPIFIVLLDCARCVECCRHCSCVMSPLTHARTDAIEKLLRYSNVKPDFKYLVCC